MDANLVQMLARSSSISLSQGSYESPERLQEVATEFEAMVIHQLLRQMREASRWLEDEDDDLFGDGLLETIDVELAKQLAMGGGLGLSDSLMPMLMDGRTGGTPYTPARPEVLGDGSLAGAITSRLDASPRALTTPPTGVTSQFVHPFVERLIGTLRRECVDRMLFWSTSDLERKLEAFQDFYNVHRAHAALEGRTPVPTRKDVARLDRYGWQAHCRGLYQTPIAA